MSSRSSSASEPVTRTVAIVQSSYVPWKGYFDLIAEVDEFVLYDGVQFRRSDWRSRNRIKAPHGLRWLTVPVRSRGRRQRIDEAEIEGGDWAREHWHHLCESYASSPGFPVWGPRIEELYAAASRDSRLSTVNERFLREICTMLGISTTISRDLEEDLRVTDPTERLVQMCVRLGATTYLTGPAARDYLRTECFDSAGISVRWADYGGYAEYPQPHGPFEHAVSILDLLLCTGTDARGYLRH